MAPILHRRPVAGWCNWQHTSLWIWELGFESLPGSAVVERPRDRGRCSFRARTRSGFLRAATVLAGAADDHDHPPARDRPRVPAAQASGARAAVLAAVRGGARLLSRGERGALHGGAADGRRPGRARAPRALGVRAGRVRQRPPVRGVVAVLGRAGDGVQDRDGGQAARAGGVGAAAGGRAAGRARQRGARPAPVRAARLRRRGRAGRSTSGPARATCRCG